MRICYIARHDQVTTSNDDEGAIAHALEVLGHSVTLVHEQNALLCPTDGFDLLLCHKLESMAALDRFKGKCKRAFWYFDLVDWPDDPVAIQRSRMRKEWMQSIIPNVEVGFCTDGDWVTKWNLLASMARPAGGLDHLCILRQGADERVVGRGTWRHNTPPRILFVGGKNSSSGRRLFIEEMRARYGPAFWQINHGIWRRELADQIAGSQIVVCPNSPVTNNYWSNRVYIMLGFGAFTIHPLCTDLTKEFFRGEELVYYDNWDELHEMISFYMDKTARRKEISAAGLEAIRDRGLYRHRCERLINIVKGL